MEKTLRDKFDISMAASERLIAEMEKRLAKAIKRENWSEAAMLDSYINGMKQIKTVFELSNC